MTMNLGSSAFYPYTTAVHNPSKASPNAGVESQQGKVMADKTSTGTSSDSAQQLIGQLAALMQQSTPSSTTTEASTSQNALMNLLQGRVSNQAPLNNFPPAIQNTLPLLMMQSMQQMFQMMMSVMVQVFQLTLASRPQPAPPPPLPPSPPPGTTNQNALFMQLMTMLLQAIMPSLGTPVSTASTSNTPKATDSVVETPAAQQKKQEDFSSLRTSWEKSPTSLKEPNEIQKDETTSTKTPVNVSKTDSSESKPSTAGQKKSVLLYGDPSLDIGLPSESEDSTQSADVKRVKALPWSLSTEESAAPTPVFSDPDDDGFSMALKGTLLSSEGAVGVGEVYLSQGDDKVSLSKTGDIQVNGKTIGNLKSQATLSDFQVRPGVQVSTRKDSDNNNVFFFSNPQYQVQGALKQDYIDTLLTELVAQAADNATGPKTMVDQDGSVSEKTLKDLL